MTNPNNCSELSALDVEQLKEKASDMGIFLGSIDTKAGIICAIKAHETRFWTREDEEQLEELFAQGMGVGRVAQALNRSVSSCRNRISNMGLRRESGLALTARVRHEGPRASASEFVINDNFGTIRRKEK